MSSLSQVYQAHPMHVQHEHPDFNTQKELPESYTWTHEAHTYNCSLKESVPIIDLNVPNASKLIGDACKTWGMFQVMNHGIPTRLLDDIEWLLQSLFSLPSHQKQKAARSPHGVAGYGLARISTCYPKLMWYEGFTIVGGSPLEHFRQLWPQDYAKYCDIVMQYDETIKKLAENLMWLILDSLGITKKDLKWADSTKGEFEKANTILHLNSYPPCPDPDRAMGLAPHTDSTLLNILYQNNIDGFQFYQEGTGWVALPPILGGIMVNVGDLLHILSNGLYPSVLHRTLVNRTHQRLSITYLHGPPPNVKICPHEKLVGPNQPPLYRPVTWNEFLDTKAKYFDKALSSIKLCAPTNSSFDESEPKKNSVQEE